jgi:hypothetical protein
VPRDAEAALGLAVVGEQPICRLGRPGAERGSCRRSEADEGAPCPDDVASVASERQRQPRDDGVRVPPALEPETEVQALLVERPQA